MRTPWELERSHSRGGGCEHHKWGNGQYRKKVEETPPHRQKHTGSDGKEGPHWRPPAGSDLQQALMALLDKDRAVIEAHSGFPTLRWEGEAWKKYRGYHCSEIENYSEVTRLDPVGWPEYPKPEEKQRKQTIREEKPKRLTQPSNDEEIEHLECDIWPWIIAKIRRRSPNQGRTKAYDAERCNWRLINSWESP